MGILFPLTGASVLPTSLPLCFPERNSEAKFVLVLNYVPHHEDIRGDWRLHYVSVLFQLLR